MVQCHKKPEQVNLLLNALDDPDLDIYIHIDKKSNIKSGIKAGQQIHILPDEYRVDVGWAVFSQVEATLNLMKYASAHGDYGQMKKDDRIDGLLEQLGLENRNYSYSQKQLLPEVSYDEAAVKMEELRGKSIDWLRNAVID